MQRLLDIVFSGLALLVLSPLLLPIALALRLTGEGEVFYVQQRVGRGGALFGLYKFATMLKNSPNLGTGTVTVKHDPRVLPMGRFLRKTKINELPQLLNIFKGDMSVIGPRPQTQRCFDAFPASAQAQIVKVTDIVEIAAYGVMSTPGLVVDENVVSTGKVLTTEEIGKLI